MPFGNEALPSIIIKYDVQRRPDIDMTNLEYVREQLTLARRYGNKLREDEINRRNAISEARRQLFPEYDRLEQELEATKLAVKNIEDEIQRASQRARKKIKPTPEQRTRLAEAKLHRKTVAAQLKDMRGKLWSDPVFLPAIEAIEEKAKADRIASRKWASHELGLYSYSYLGVENSLSKLRKGTPPKFRKWNGDGRLCSQFQTNKSYPEPMSWERACLGVDSRLKVRRQDTYTIVSVRLGSQGREPVWVDCPIVMHRPLPDHCRITWVYLVRRMVGLREKYNLCFVCARPWGFQKPDLAATGKVAIDVGWRLVDDGQTLVTGPSGLQWARSGPGLRVAYWLGDDGRQGSLVIPQARIDYANKCKDLQSIRDQRFDEIKAQLQAYLGSLAAVPDWLAEAAKYLDKIKSKDRLVKLVDAWQRHAGDEAIYEALSYWRDRKEIHLHTWEADQRHKFSLYRKNLYGQFWAMLRRQYHTAIVESLNLSDMRRTEQPGDDATPPAMILYRNIASVGLLLSSATMPTEARPAQYTTVRCHACQAICYWDMANELEHTCEHCGAHWDQDENACHNLLASEGVIKDSNDEEAA